MRTLSIGVVDLVANGVQRSLYARIMFPNFASVMPQAVAVWGEQAGHRVSFLCYTGRGNLTRMLPGDLDVVFICAFTHAALLAYATSAYYRSRGAVTVLGGPHARSFPEHALDHFDYVVGLANRELIHGILGDPRQQRPRGIRVSAPAQPRGLPGVRERWKYIRGLHRRTPVPSTALLGSLGCPYTCNFCADAEVPYQMLELDEIRDDLRFLGRRLHKPLVVWHDPNFGVQFDRYLDLIEDAVRPGTMEFVAETSLSLLTESRLRRLARNGFRAMLPGIESWYELGNKSGTGRTSGEEKLDGVVDQIESILRYIPYVQANFVLGLDSDQGEEPFELTKRFIDRAPGVFPASAMLTAYGDSAPLSRELQKQGRVLPVPFQFLNSGHVSNVKPKHYPWPQFYDHMRSLVSHAFSPEAIYRRHRAVGGFTPRLIHFARAVSAEGWGRARYLDRLRARLDADAEFRRFLDGEKLAGPPAWMIQQVKHELGPMWDWLPRNALGYESTVS